MTSPSGHFRLVLENDGNVVVYEDNLGPAWASDTIGKKGTKLTMQNDGNLVLSTASNSAVWSTATAGHPGAFAQLGDDGHLVVMDGTTLIFWEENFGPSMLVSGASLAMGQILTAPKGEYFVKLQTDGNVVIYDTVIGGHETIWSFDTVGKNGTKLTMQEDGNLVLYTAAGAQVWESGTAGHAGAFAQMTSDGRLVVVDGTTPIWETRISGPTTMVRGEFIIVGQELISPSGRYRMPLQPDGNVVVYDGTTAVWATNTAGKGGTKLIMQNDGNLVLYTPAGVPVWATNTTEGFAQLQDDGNLVIRAGADLIWESRTHGPSRIPSGEFLGVGQELVAFGGRYRLLLQNDGNVVVYFGTTAVWATNTAGKGGTKLIMQNDGNLVLYTPAGVPVWASGTEGHPGAFAILVADGNLEIFGRGVIWESRTAGPSVLIHEEFLAVGQELKSPNGRYRMPLQADGNVVVYDGTQPKWATNTAGTGGTILFMTERGNLELHNSSGVVWSSDTDGNRSTVAILNDAGDLAIFDGLNPIWVNGHAI